ncbi:DUF262 domain-containing protein [Streptomyces sp. NPDC017958]|uniref:DUF262 domain-containing protein n=1 Tax=Streptomyces sp. NPDC017958 TaxID=3365021 RepID=UPI0037B99BC4
MAKRTAKGRTSVKDSDEASYTYDLMKGEEFGYNDAVDRKIISDEELNSRYVKGDIRIVSESARYSLAGMLQEEVAVEGDRHGATERRYKLDPEYQRRHRWTNQRKSKLIESFLMNIPVPPVFLYERDLARFEVMDGRQRLTALAEFYDNKFPLEGLEYWSDLDGRTYSELPSKVRDGIDRRYISSIILLKETAANEEQAALLKKIVFERLNSGGVKLSPQETRNAVYGGPLNQLCIRLSTNEKFRRMWGIPIDVENKHKDEDALEDNFDPNEENSPTLSGERMFEKMEDVEVVLRFFAYRHIHRSKSGLNKISEFLDNFLSQGNKFTVSILTEYENSFNATIDFLYDCLGVEAFSVLTETKQARPTKIVYDPIMFIANAPDVVAARSKIVANKAALRRALISMYAADQERSRPAFSGRRTNNADIAVRNRAMRAAFESILRTVA